MPGREGFNEGERSCSRLLLLQPLSTTPRASATKQELCVPYANRPTTAKPNCSLLKSNSVPNANANELLRMSSTGEAEAAWSVEESALNGWARSAMLLDLKCT